MPLRALAGEQLAVAAGQLAAGVGNLAFSLVAARLLAPGAFAHLASFLALYLLVHVPAASLSAGSALTPELADRSAGACSAPALPPAARSRSPSIPLAALLHLPLAMVLAARRRRAHRGPDRARPRAPVRPRALRGARPRACWPSRSSG